MNFLLPLTGRSPLFQKSNKTLPLHLLHLSKYVSEMVLLHLLLNKNYKLTCICYIYVSKYVSEMHLLINTN